MNDLSKQVMSVVTVEPIAGGRYAIAIEGDVVRWLGDFQSYAHAASAAHAERARLAAAVRLVEYRARQNITLTEWRTTVENTAFARFAPGKELSQDLAVAFCVKLVKNYKWFVYQEPEESEAIMSGYADTLDAAKDDADAWIRANPKRLVYRLPDAPVEVRESKQGNDLDKYKLTSLIYSLKEKLDTYDKRSEQLRKTPVTMLLSHANAALLENVVGELRALVAVFESNPEK